MIENSFQNFNFMNIFGKFPKSIIIVSAILVSLFLSCKPNDNKEYPIYLISENNDLNCVELTYNNITYRPFGVLLNNKLKGTQIGVRENSPNSKIYEINGYSSNEWIVEYLEVLMGTNMIFKEINVNSIPQELVTYKQYDF